MATTNSSSADYVKIPARVHLANMSLLPQRRWCRLPVPATFNVPDHCIVKENGITPIGRAVKGELIGGHTRMMHLLADLTGNSSHAAYSITLNPLDSPPPPFHVDAELLQQLPQPRLFIHDLFSGGIAIPLTSVQPLIEVLSPACTRVTWRGSTRGWAWQFYATLWHDQRVIDFQLAAAWSDRTRADLRNPLYSFRLDAGPGCQVLVDFARHRGFIYSDAEDQVPVQGPARYCSALGAMGDIGDGQALRLTGSIAPMDLGTENSVAEPLTEPIVVASFWPVFGPVAGKFPNPLHYYPLGHREDMDALVAPYVTTDSVFGKRPLANELYAGSTGTQWPFGSFKDMDTACNAYRLYVLSTFSADDGPLRGYHHFDINGEPITIDEHPGWQTWGGQTERNSPDMIGKTRERPNGWNRNDNGRSVDYDDQHRGDLGRLFAYAMTGDPSLRDDILCQFQADRARAKRARRQTDAPRASGRLWQSWAWMRMLFPEHADTIDQMAADELELWEAKGEGWLDIIYSANYCPGRPTAMLWHEALAVLGALQYSRAVGLPDGLRNRFSKWARTRAIKLGRYGLTTDQSTGLVICVNALATDSMLDADFYKFPRENAGYNGGAGRDMVVGGNAWLAWWSGVLDVVSNGEPEEVGEEQKKMAQRAINQIRVPDNFGWITGLWIPLEPW